MTATNTTGASSSHRVFVGGATGGVGLRLTTLLVKQGHDVSGLHRSADSAGTIRDAGTTPVQGDVAAGAADDFATRLADHFMDGWRGDESPGKGFELYTKAKQAAESAVTDPRPDGQCKASA